MKTKKKPLHEILCDVLGSRNCYFSPPSSIKMKYPCIRYDLSALEIRNADDISYYRYPRYEIILIDENPDSKIVEKLLDIPFCSFDRKYSVDGLNHFAFTLFFKGNRIEEE